jgi:hypothetical protein
MNLTRTFLAVSFIFVCAIAAPAQEGRCNLKLTQAPTLRGLRLGMSTEQVRAVFPKVSIPLADENGSASGFAAFSSEPDANAVNFKGVSAIYLSFFDNRLVRFSVQYDGSVQWDSSARFSTKVSESLRLPDLWVSGSGGSRKLSCDGFEVETNSYNNGSIGMRETTGWEAVIERRAKEIREKKQQAFKP